MLERMNLIAVLLTLLCNTYDASRRMYETRTVTTAGAFDCIHDVVARVLNDHLFESNVRFHTVRFCRQSTLNPLSQQKINITHGTPITFHRLRSSNITAEQLFSWNAPMDTIEDYRSGVEVGLFMNCSQDDKYWFGPNCEYTFDSSSYFPDIVDDQFNAKEGVPDDLLTTDNSVCLETGDVECQSVLCLDWREICDGKIDCTNGADEEYCHRLEMNECNPSTEYRCLNGQCIDKLLYWDSYPDCMDSTDETVTHNNFCFQNFDFRCQDKLCPSTWFSCGDGDCHYAPTINSPESSCKSHRDLLYYKQTLPSTIILFSHIFITYHNLTPISICFNKTLCPYLSNDETMTTIDENGLSCRAFDTFGRNATYIDFSSMIRDLKRLVLSCSFLPRNDVTDNCTLFQCNDGSKCLSKHRLADGGNDCSDGEDEHQSNTCDLNHQYRFKCDNHIKCIHPSLIRNYEDDCGDGSDEEYSHVSLCSDAMTEECYAHRRQAHQFNMTFSQLCNNIVERIPDANNDTDESNCPMSQWNCFTQYTRCNEVWNCPDGRDELNCQRSLLSLRYCDSVSHFCLNIRDGNQTCLSKQQAGDGVVDCVGSTDEREYCRVHYPYEFKRRYRCQNSTKCILISEICDCHQDCPWNDDETIACHWLNNGKETNCDPHRFRCRDGEYSSTVTFRSRCNDNLLACSDKENVLFCDLNDRSTSRPFQTNDIPEVPKSKINPLARSSTKENDLIHWYCNRGIYVYSPSSPLDFYCMCTESYYGHRCQFQRKRVALILQLQTTSSFNAVLSSFKVVLLLVRNHTSNTIVSHDQLV
ncbi:unnamed protein product, partial [Adineta ricciae]